MKQILLILATSATLSAWGQVGQNMPKSATDAGAKSRQRSAVSRQGADGGAQELELPATEGRAEVLVRGMDAVDLENRIGSQTGCPLQILNASFERPARLMLTSQTSSGGVPTLHLNYRNSSGEDIESVVLTGWIKVKDSLYQLDSSSRPFRMELSLRALLGNGVKATQALALTSNAIGFDRIELTQVAYVDGTTWSPEHRSCVYSNAGLTERARDW